MKKVMIILISLLMTANLFAQDTSSDNNSYTNDRIKVGVFVSLYSGNGPSWWDGSKIGFGHVDIAERFNDTNTYELFALVDPGTESYPEIQEQLHRYNFSKTILDASNVEDLKTVDVIVSGYYHVNIYWSILDAVKEAVNSGVHLVNVVHFGLIRPAYATGNEAIMAESDYASHMNPEIRNNPHEVKEYKKYITELFGLENPQFIWHLPALEWELSNSHPILGFVEPGKTVNTIGINGLVGTMQTDQPFKLASESIIDKWNGRTVYKNELDPFSIYRCGKGLAINIGLFGNFDSLGFTSREDFARYCADWAVRNAKEAKATRSVR